MARPGGKMRSLRNGPGRLFCSTSGRKEGSSQLGIRSFGTTSPTHVWHRIGRPQGGPEAKLCLHRPVAPLTRSKRSTYAAPPLAALEKPTSLATKLVRRCHHVALPSTNNPIESEIRLNGRPPFHPLYLWMHVFPPPPRS